MSVILALATDRTALDDLQARYADQVADGTAEIGGLISVFDADPSVADQLSGEAEVRAVATEDQVTGLGATLDGLAADPSQTGAVATSLFGAAADQLDAQTLATFGSWLVQFGPAFQAAMAAREPELEDPWADVGACLDNQQMPPPPPDSPLRSPRFAGDPVLEACLQGTHRMMAPEQGIAVVKVQSALLDLGFALPTAGADGVFGSETGVAVTAFKQQQGLTPDDPVVGSGTMGQLDQLFAP